jgi:hypothetical protein
VNVTVTREEFDKLVSIALEYEVPVPFLVNWANANEVESVQIIGTLIVIWPE